MLNWIKEHPYLTGGLILGLIVAWILFRNITSSSAATQTTVTGTTGPSDALQALEVQSGAQVQSAQIAANAQVAGLNAQTNIAALQSQQAIVTTQIGAGVTDTQTAAQLQLGLANLGLTPGTSPFGPTLMIQGFNPGNASTPVITSAPTPVSQPDPITTTPIVTTGGPTTAAGSLVNAAGSSPATSALASITPQTTGAGSGGDVNVPATPIYLPGTSGPQVVGYTQPATLPSSKGLNWQQYWNEISGSLNTGSTSPANAAQLAAEQAAAEQEYSLDPGSCHNTVCSAA